MRKRSIYNLSAAITLIAILSTLTACGSDKNGNETESKNNSTPSKSAMQMSQPLTQAQLKTAALAVADVPGTTAGETSTEPSPVTSVTPRVCEPFVQAGTTVKDRTAYYQVNLNASGKNIVQELASYSSKASSQVEVAAALIDKCPSVTGTQEGVTSTIKIAKKDIAPIGDKSLAFTASIVIQGQPLSQDIVYIASGHTFIILAFQSVTSGFDTAAEEEVARKAVAKLAVK